MSGPYTPTRGRFAGETFASHRQYRNALARLSGFQSEHTRRRSRRGLSVAKHPVAQESRRRALDGLAFMRREGLDLKTAARMAGTTPNTMLRHLSPRALRKGPDGRWRATRTDTFERRMQMQTTVGAQSVRPRNSREASLIAHHANAIRLFLNGRPEGERLVGAFAGKRAAGFEFETDLDVLEDEALRGELTAESIYETTH